MRRSVLHTEVDRRYLAHTPASHRATVRRRSWNSRDAVAPGSIEAMRSNIRSRSRRLATYATGPRSEAFKTATAARISGSGVRARLDTADIAARLDTADIARRDDGLLIARLDAVDATLDDRERLDEDSEFTDDWRLLSEDEDMM